MRTKQLESEVAAALLGGEDPEGVFWSELRKGLSVISELRALLRPLTGDLASARGRGYSLTRVKGKRLVAICYLEGPRPPWWPPPPRKRPALVAIRYPRGKNAVHIEVLDAAYSLAKLTNRDVEQATKLLEAIERARKALFAVAEENSRWLL